MVIDYFASFECWQCSPSGRTTSATTEQTRVFDDIIIWRSSRDSKRVSIGRLWMLSPWTLSTNHQLKHTTHSQKHGTNFVKLNDTFAVVLYIVQWPSANGSQTWSMKSSLFYSLNSSSSSLTVPTSSCKPLRQEICPKILPHGCA